MKKLENMLEHQLNEGQSVTYPDFESMWERIEHKIQHLFTLG